MTTDADALVDHGAVAAAEAVLAEAEGRLRAARTGAEDADARTEALRRELPELVERAAAGEPVTVEMVADIHARVRDATAYATFAATLARRLEEPVAAARAALADVRHAAWWPVFRRGQDLRIAAAVKADRARMLGNWGMNTPPGEVPAMEAAKNTELAKAKPLFDQGTELVRLAWRNGVRFRSPVMWGEPEWPSKEQSERAFWDRPLTVEEMAHAAL